MRKRLLWLDIAKGIAISLVVMGHCLDSGTWLRAFIYSFHMALFFVLAGFTARPKRRREVLTGSVRRLMLPYALVSAILLLFAFVPPDSINPNLDSQYSWDVVVMEILYGAGDAADFLGWHFEAIGAIWFLPCLFFARLVLNEILLLGQFAKRRLAARGSASDLCRWAVMTIAVLAVVWAGFWVGERYRLPLSLDTACIAVFYLYIGFVAKRIDIGRVPGVVWVVLLVVWFQYAQAGNNEMAVRAYLENPYSLLTSAAGSLVVMRCCIGLEQAAQARRRLPGRVLARCNGALAWAGVSSLAILCVHRVESAVFNWQKIMETFAPGVWGWPLTWQGLYQFALRFALVAALTFALQRAWRIVRRSRGRTGAVRGE